MKLHVFNPEHDLALAAKQSQFTAPHAGRQLRSDLAFIPALWADEGDFVLVDDIDNARDKVRHLGAQYINKVEFITKLQLEQVFAHSMEVDSIHPWGWDFALKHELTRIGCPEIMLPTDESLAEIRTMSNRKFWATRLQHGVKYVESLEQLKQLVAQLGKAVIKAPWSCSGRGVRYVTAEDFENSSHHVSLDNWIANIIARQGGMTVEPYCNKVKDFGMEFEMRDGKVNYLGLSLFHTIKNAYTGNIIASEKDKEEMLATYVSRSQQEMLKEHVAAVVEPCLKNVYQGPFGVDMMVCSESAESGKTFVNPCIELNLRRTMGHVSLSLAGFGLERPHVMQVAFDGNRYRLRVLPGEPSEDAPLH